MVSVSTLAWLSSPDFEEDGSLVLAQDIYEYLPQVLVLAFDALADAQHLYLDVFRRSSLIHALAHRTIVLCGKSNLQQAYELCREEFFDDYVLFWPLNHDAPRLCMAVHNALRQLNETPSSAPFADRKSTRLNSSHYCASVL